MIETHKLNSIGSNAGTLTLSNGPYNILGYSIFGDKTNDAVITFFHDASTYVVVPTHATEIYTVATGHKFPNLHPVLLTNSGGGLPTGSTERSWVIWVSPTTFQLASSLVDAIAGTPDAISDDGTGTHSVTGYDVWADQLVGAVDAKVFAFPKSGLPSLGEVTNPIDLVITLDPAAGVATAYIIVEKI